MRFRPFSELDLEALNRVAGHRPLSPGAVRHFARTGHSFLAEEGEEPLGFALAQAVWQGEATTVLVVRIEGISQAVLEGLLAAVVKSAYDAGVYEVALHLDPARRELAEALRAQGFAVGPLVLAVRVLGSRGLRGEARGVLE
ncbi:MAG: DUF1999 domain-containing protein [Thermus sp.]|uniref:DUF1999 family protein n=1 Tax=Thermus sp. TaxID=275 RepID=UPI0025F08C86|nr:DUF1999 family protein [Thermus sp.]MCS6869407.1 DUF1999 domain-containing protein [Thermus sp.]MCS7218295.1 DUF1999 domain-containing protein [Thermus sp.]MCX7849107.1 DUF1999 domain-containing protein [Thermus sp.]MDW8016279.1 DUF1999 family protein [Thermus sp.]MDW8356709.1 DUF1999 family protein [Thermus sp.]